MPVTCSAVAVTALYVSIAIEAVSRPFGEQEGGGKKPHSRDSLDSLIMYFPDVARIRNELLIVIMKKSALLLCLPSFLQH